jgi:hypothetical protein
MSREYRKVQVRKAIDIAKAKRTKKATETLEQDWIKFKTEWDESYKIQKQKMIDEGREWDEKLDKFYSLTKTEYLFGLITSHDSKGEHSISEIIHNFKMSIEVGMIKDPDMNQLESNLFKRYLELF